jgi:hypothetical protein
MIHRWSRMSRTARIGLIAATVFTLILLLAAGSQLAGGPDNRTETAGSPADPTSEPTASSDLPTNEPRPTTSPEPSHTSDSESLPELPDTSDPDEYAAAVAEVVLGLNPRDHARADYLELLLGEIRDDVSSEDRERVGPVIESWLPEEFQWQRQRDYGQVHTFTAESVWVPEVIEDSTDDIPAEYQVRTVAGTQTTAFLDEDDRVAKSATPRLITVISYCPTSGEPCALLSIPQEVQR